jgi:hypothetical protein
VKRIGTESTRKTFRIALCLTVLAIAAAAGCLRWRAVNRLPVDYDELVYLPTAFQYQRMLTSGRWGEIPGYTENMEHPPLNKLLFAADLAVQRANEPDWDKLEVGRPIPPADRPAFRGPRLISAAGGTLQVLIMSLAHPIAGLLLALDTYHIKYSAQVYLEGVPGLMAVLAVFLFELGLLKQQPPRRPRWTLLLLSAVTLGLAAAGKYLYGIAGFVLLAFLIHRTRSARAALTYCLAALVVFLLADPYLWPDPPVRLWESLTYHWHYSHSRHVVESAMPWYSPFVHLLRAAPFAWHPGVFYTGLADVVILPLAVVGLPASIRRRPVWPAWAGFGLFFLLIWPTKWPQYILLVLPPLCVCAAMGIEQIARFLRNRLAGLSR